MGGYDILIQKPHEAAQGILKCCSYLHPQPSAPPCLENVVPQRTTPKSTAHSVFLESTYIKRILPMELVCRWELHPQKVLDMCEGTVTHLKLLFSFGFSHLFRSLCLNTSTAITALLTWKHMRPWKERFSFPQSFLNPVREGHHSPHSDFLSQRSLCWQDSLFHLT